MANALLSEKCNNSMEITGNYSTSPMESPFDQWLIIMYFLQEMTTTLVYRVGRLNWIHKQKIGLWPATLIQFFNLWESLMTCANAPVEICAWKADWRHWKLSENQSVGVPTFKNWITVSATRVTLVATDVGWVVECEVTEKLFVLL